MADTFTDEQLAANYLAGDEHALKALVERHLKPLYNFVYRFVGDAAAAEDIVQESFIKCWRNLKKFDSKKVFRTWLYQIAKNTAIDYLRKKQPGKLAALKDREGSEIPEPASVIADDRPLISTVLEREETAEEVREAVAKLALPYKIILDLYYNSDLNFREISEVLGEPLDTVKSRHFRAIAQLRKLLAGGA